MHESTQATVTPERVEEESGVPPIGITTELVPTGEVRVDAVFQARLPSPEPREFEALVTDVRKHGILVPLLVTEDGLLLEGHRRLAVAKELKLTHVPYGIRPTQ
jgi:ParB-like chromosome segregation protein Spo0J